MIVTLADGTKLSCEDNPFAEGGEGWLFWEDTGKYVVKLYKPNVGPERERSLLDIIGPNYSVILDEKGEKIPYWDELFAWPYAIIVDPQLGLIMPKREGVDLRWLLGRKARMALLVDKGPAKLGTWRKYLDMAISMAQVVKRMHFRGLCHSDLSFRNFMVDAEYGKIVLIDCDGLVVDGFLEAGVLGTPMCMAPELMLYITNRQKASAKPSQKTDLHALSTLIYWLVFQRHPLIGPKQNHPDPQRDESLALGECAVFIENEHDRSNSLGDIPFAYKDVLTPDVQRLVERAFIDGLFNPDARPLAADWERALVRMLDSLIPCSNTKCPVGEYVFMPGKTTHCPACDTPTRGFDTLPVLHMYVREREGHFRSDHHYNVIGSPGRGIHLWHAVRGAMPGPGVDPEQKAVIEYDQARREWYFVNKDLAEVRMLDMTGHKEIAPGKRQVITDGVQLMLGPPGKCRMAYVEMMRF